MQWTDPCCFVQAGTADSDVGHGHVVNRFLSFWDAGLLLQAVQHNQRADHPAAKLCSKDKDNNV